MERLQKKISSLGYCSRRHAEELISKGLVEVNGEVITKLGTTVKPGDIISVEGNILDNSRSFEYYLLNKPKGVVTTTNDEKGRKTVVDFINTTSRIYPVGRLDYDTSGLLILTNVGDFANQMMHPRYKVDKTYVAKVEGLITPDSIKKLRNGVVIDGKPTSRARAKILSRDAKKNTSIVSLTIHEGRYHQVKKMFLAYGVKVTYLKRISFGAFKLDEGIAVGSYRALTEAEKAILRTYLG